jgi:glycosyltransferase involved in cell wall biosynthesis
LPNKIFDYIHAGLPILASPLPEIARIIETYSVGEFIENHNPVHLSEKIKDLLCSEKLKDYKHNTTLASAELNWDKEKQKLIKVIKELRH